MREFQVMTMIVSGKRIKEIADEVSLSIKTVSTCKTRVLQKMLMKGISELTAYALQHNLLGQN